MVTTVSYPFRNPARLETVGDRRAKSRRVVLGTGCGEGSSNLTDELQVGEPCTRTKVLASGTTALQKRVGTQPTTRHEFSRFE